MILSKQEAVCLIIGMAEQNNISSITKLQKLTAKLNQFLIPIDIDFSLNKYGSFNADLSGFKDDESVEEYKYDWKGQEMQGFRFGFKGKQVYENAVQKLKEIMTIEEIDKLKEDFYEFSQMSPSELSEDEHKKLLVDVEDRVDLINRINLVNCEMTDLYDDLNKLKEDTIADIRLGALIEYCYYLSKFLKEVRFRDIEHKGYGFEDYMFDYYSLYLLEKHAKDIKKQLDSTNKNKTFINRLYHYFIYYPQQRYPFSLDNPKLFKIMAK